MTISFELGEDLEAIVEMVQSVAAEVIRPRLRDFEDARGLPDDVLQQCHELGLTALGLPESVGGQGLDARTAAVISEEIAWGDVGAAVALSGPGAAAAAVLALGEATQQDRLLRPFAAPDGWKRRGALALVEGPSGWGPDVVATTCRKDGDAWVVTGEKKYVQGGGEADLTVVVAADEAGPAGWDGLRVLAIEGRPEGMTASEPLRLLGLQTARFANVKLDGVVVPGENLLATGDVRAGLRRAVARWKVINAARLVGCMRAASEYAFKYATERETFGKKLFEHQGLAFFMADMATEVNAVRWLAWRAAWALDQGGEARHEAALASKTASELATKVTSDALQVLGGHGYITDHPVEKWMRDARTLGLVHGVGVEDDHEIAEEVLS